MKTLLLSVLTYLIFAVQLYATHNIAGEISYQQLTNQMIECTITTYTNIQSVDADRDTLTISWGDGLEQRIGRVNGPDVNGNGVPDGEALANGIKFNQYIAVHVYPDVGTYILSMRDPNRNAGILNVNFPNSVSVPFYIQTEIELSTVLNSSPILLNPPIDIGYLGQPYYHIPNAFDLEGDSIAYKLITPLMDVNQVVPNYLFPQAVNAGNSTFVIEEETGLISWDLPEQIGDYTIAIEVSSYRDGQLLDKTIRDMFITIMEEGNIIPMLTADSPYSDSEINTVMVGETVSIALMTEDADNLQTVQLSSTSGLYDYFSNPATFTITAENGNSAAAVFTWPLTSEHVRDQPITIVIKSSDDLGLANYLVFRFRVLGVTANENLAPAPSEISVFPNPASAVLYLEAEDVQLEYYQIYDIKGRLLQSGQLDDTSELSIAFLPAGQYYLKIDDKQVLPFVKQ